LVRDAALAEEAGFDFATISDHYSPWLEEQGHSPYAWAVLGAIAQVTEEIDLVSLVTCPTRRYHPTVVAQKAATMGLLSEGRFTLGIGAGENLNEHVVGAWPRTQDRHDALGEALEIIRGLLDGEALTYSGNHFEVADARIYDLPPEPVPVAVAMSGPTSAQLAGDYGDAMVAVAPKPEYIRLFDAAGGSGKPRYGQLNVCYGPDEGACRRIAHEQTRFATLGWKVMAELPNTEAFAAATKYVRPEDVAQTVPCGPDLGQHVSAVREYVDAGFTHVAIVQVGGENQRQFLSWAQRELLPALRGE
jgi:G6PDH family F420-dependent oxidoreductase